MKVLVPLRRQPPSPGSPGSASTSRRSPPRARSSPGTRSAEPSISPGSQRSFCAAEAWRASRPTTMSAWWRTVAAVERQAAASSSPTMQSSASPRPAPPYSAGAVAPSRPELGGLLPALLGEGLGGVDRLRRAGRPRAGTSRGRSVAGASARARGRGPRAAAAAPQSPSKFGLAVLEEGARALAPVARGEQRGEPVFDPQVGVGDRQVAVAAQAFDDRLRPRAARSGRSSRPAPSPAPSPRPARPRS